MNCVAPGADLDAAERRRQAGAKGGEARRTSADEASRPTGGGRAGVRVLRLERRFELHHRRGADFAGRRDSSRMDDLVRVHANTRRVQHIRRAVCTRFHLARGGRETHGVGARTHDYGTRMHVRVIDPFNQKPTVCGGAVQ